MSTGRKVVPLSSLPAFLFEMRSERMAYALKALEEWGFKVTSVKDTNRYVIEDEDRFRQQGES